MSTDRAVVAWGENRSHVTSVMSLSRYAYLGAVIGAALTVYLIRLWQPEQQVSKHSAHLLEALAQRNWPKFREFIADDYHDEWSNDRAAVLERTREVFRYLREVKLTASTPTTRVTNRSGYWTAKIIVEGRNDNEMIVAVKERVNALESPFELEWHKNSGKPWDWKLVSARNPSLVLPSGY